MFSEIHNRVKKAGQAPGTPIYTGEKNNEPPCLNIITYSATDSHHSCVAEWNEALVPPTKPGKVWIDVAGLQDVALIEQIANYYQLHPLTVEDILNVQQRPKVEEFDNYVFITLKMLFWHAKSQTFTIKQISFVVGKNFVLSFQERASDLFNSLQKKIGSATNQRLREQDTDYLAYRLIDTVIDQYFLVLEGLGNQIEWIEEHIIASPTPHNARTLYQLKRQMLALRKAVWPMREAISHLLQVDNALFTSFTRIYLRDVYDHAVQAIDTIENFRDMLGSMLDVYLSSLTNRMNEIMKVLTIISTFFMPMTFLASVYGMNFPNIPGLHSPWGFTATIGAMVIIGIAMLFYFHHKKWL
jgi:magnesium transporter